MTPFPGTRRRRQHRTHAKFRKTLNNILSVLGKLLRVAVKWKVIAAMPCAIELTKNEKTVHAFYDADAVRRLMDATRNTRERVLVLLLRRDRSRRTRSADH